MENNKIKKVYIAVSVVLSIIIIWLIAGMLKSNDHSDNDSLKDVINNQSDKKLFDDGLKELRKTIDSCNKEHLWIDNEVHLIEKIKKNGTILKRDRGRADIWIGTNNYHGYDIDFKIAKYRLIIENKINAGPQDFQLRRYYRYLNENGFSREFGGLFLLCIDTNSDNTQKAIKSANSFPNESLLEGNKRPDTQFAIITYKDDIKPWLIEVKNNAQNDDFLKVVSDYLEIVESLN